MGGAVFFDNECYTLKGWADYYVVFICSLSLCQKDMNTIFACPPCSKDSSNSLFCFLCLMILLVFLLLLLLVLFVLLVFLRLLLRRRFFIVTIDLHRIRRLPLLFLLLLFLLPH